MEAAGLTIQGNRRAASWMALRPAMGRIGSMMLRCATHLPPGVKRRLKRSRLARHGRDWLARAAVSPVWQAPAPLCVLPWIHAHVATTGDVHLCCLALGNDSSLGNVRERPVCEIFESAAFGSIRLQMLRGEWPRVCSGCKDRESLGLPSYRHYSNSQHPDRVRQLVSDPRTVTPRIRSIDLRLNNICNFKCRSCGGIASNRWFSDHNLIYPEAKLEQSYVGFDKLPAFWMEFDQQILPDLDALTLAGGEPLLSQSQYLLLEKLIATRKQDIRLLVNTNLSQLRFMQWDAIELWKNFRNLQLTMSLDGVGSQGEYIRYGMSYSKWMENAKRVKRELPNATRCLHFVVSIFNVIDLRIHYDEIVQNEIVDPNLITFTFLESPAYLSVQVLSPQLKATVEHDICAWLASARTMPGPVRIQIEALVRFMKQSDGYSVHGREFATKTKLLDQARGEDASALFPRLKSMLVS